MEQQRGESKNGKLEGGVSGCRAETIGEGTMIGRRTGQWGSWEGDLNIGSGEEPPFPFEQSPYLSNNSLNPGEGTIVCSKQVCGDIFFFN